MAPRSHPLPGAQQLRSLRETPISRRHRLLSVCGGIKALEAVYRAHTGRAESTQRHRSADNCRIRTIGALINAPLAASREVVYRLGVERPFFFVLSWVAGELRMNLLTKLKRRNKKGTDRRSRKGKSKDRDPADRQTVHYLHIGKTGGSAVKHALREENAVDNGSYLFVLHEHEQRLRDLPAGDPYVFAVRDPLERFYSGFYSRKRKGQPRILSEWTPREQRAFARFTDANDLAEALTAEDLELRCAALSAMTGIGHVNTAHLDWFDDPHEMFYGDRPPLMVLRQSQLNADFSALASLLNLPSTVHLPHDNVSAHRNDYSQTPPLGALARQNIRSWYATDIAFVEIAESFAARKTAELLATRSKRAAIPAVTSQTA